MEEKQQYSLISEALPKALFVFLKTLFYFIVLPYKILIYRSHPLTLRKTSESLLASLSTTPKWSTSGSAK